MKPPLFDYHRATSIDAALARLAEDPDTLVLAGGQSLVPAMNFRLVSPFSVVDINGIEALATISVTGDEIVVGACVRHRDLELDDRVFAANPILRKALAHVAHVPIRHRGTTVGSLCHADAAAEMPMILLLTGGSVTARSTHGERRIPADAFFQFHMTTTRQPGELIVDARFPVLPKGAGCGFAEFARRQGDYALAAIGAIVATDAGGTVTAASLAACGIANRPVRLHDAEAALIGQTLSADLLARVGEIAAQDVTAPDDTLATTAYRKHLVRGLTVRAIAEATKAEVNA